MLLDPTIWCPSDLFLAAKMGLKFSRYAMGSEFIHCPPCPGAEWASQLNPPLGILSIINSFEPFQLYQGLGLGYRSSAISVQDIEQRRRKHNGNGIFLPPSLFFLITNLFVICSCWSNLMDVLSWLNVKCLQFTITMYVVEVKYYISHYSLVMYSCQPSLHSCPLITKTSKPSIYNWYWDMHCPSNELKHIDDQIRKVSLFDDCQDSINGW